MPTACVILAAGIVSFTSIIIPYGLHHSQTMIMIHGLLDITGPHISPRRIIHIVDAVPLLTIITSEIMLPFMVIVLTRLAMAIMAPITILIITRIEITHSKDTIMAEG